MPTVSRRRPSSKPVSRRRDRVREELPDEEEYDEEGEDFEDEDFEDEDEDEEVEVTSRRPPKRNVVTRRRETVEEEEEEDEDEAPRPRKKATARTTTKKAAARKKKKTTTDRPGIRKGWAGVDEIKSMGGNAPRFKPSAEPQLVKFLEPEPFADIRQHWVPQGGGQPDRPYTCIGTDCPLCDMGNRASPSVCLNVLLLSGVEVPENKVLQVGIRASESLRSSATSKNGSGPDIENGFFAVSRSGEGQRSQTNFRPVKQRDLEEDWAEIFDVVDPEELDAVIEEARANIFEDTIIDHQTRRELIEVSRYLADDDN